MSGLQSYAKVLESVDGVSAWVLRRVRSREAQRYIIFDRPGSGSDGRRDHPQGHALS